MTVEDRIARLERRHRVLLIVFAVFATAHALLIPLLPQLFEHALQASVGALVLGVVVVALIVTKRAS